MAGDSLNMEPVVCARCGSKFAAVRDRCPKCRMRVSRMDPAAHSPHGRRLAQASGIILGVGVLGLTLLWVTTDAPPDTAVTAASVDPLPSHRAHPDVDEHGGNVPLERDTQRRYMEPLHLGALSYGAGDYEGALARFQEAIDRNPGDAESISNLGQVLVKLGRTEEAIPHFERACTLNPDRWAYRFNLARALALLKRWDESIDSYRHAQRLFPDDYVTTFNLGLTLHKKGDDRGAIAEYTKAVALNPDEPSFHMALGISYEALRQNQDAATAYADYLRLVPSAPDAEQVRARITLLTGQRAAPVAAPAGL